MKTKLKVLICCLFLTMGSAMAQNNEDYYTYSNRMGSYYDSLRTITPDTLKVAG